MGVDLDIEVAKKVFGWNYQAHDNAWSQGIGWFDERRIKMHNNLQPPSFSSDRRETERVERKMCLSLNMEMILRFDKKSVSWTATFDSWRTQGEGRFASEAICCAAVNCIETDKSKSQKQLLLDKKS